MVTHCLDVELEDLAISLDPQLQAVVAGQVDLQGLGAGPTEAPTLWARQQTGVGSATQCSCWVSNAGQLWGQKSVQLWDEQCNAAVVGKLLDACKGVMHAWSHNAPP